MIQLLLGSLLYLLHLLPPFFAAILSLHRYRLWWYFTVFAACLTGWLTTYRLAFLNAGYK